MAWFRDAKGYSNHAYCFYGSHCLWGTNLLYYDWTGLGFLFLTMLYRGGFLFCCIQGGGIGNSRWLDGADGSGLDSMVAVLIPDQ